MSRLVSLGFASFAMILSSAVSAQSATPNASAAPQAAASDEKVCKSEDVVGSRFKKKICRTQAEWLALQQNSRSSVEGYQQNACRQGASSQGGSIQC